MNENILKIVSIASISLLSIVVSYSISFEVAVIILLVLILNKE